MKVALRFLLILCFAAATALVEALGSLRGGAPGVIAWYAFESLYLWLPAVAGIAVGSVGAVRRREVLVIVGLTMATMIASDFLPPSGLGTVDRDLNSTAEGIQVQDSERDRWSSAGAFRVVSAHLSGDIPGASEVSFAYRVDSPRFVVALAYLKAAFLLAPLVVTGFVIGALNWASANLLFKSRSAENVVGFLLGWVLGPVVSLVLGLMSEQVLLEILTTPVSFTLFALPYLTMLAIAGLGWWLSPQPAR